MVWNANEIYRRVMDIIDTVQKLIADVKALSTPSATSSPPSAS